MKKRKDSPFKIPVKPVNIRLNLVVFSATSTWKESLKVCGYYGRNLERIVIDNDILYESGI